MNLSAVQIRLVMVVGSQIYHDQVQRTMCYEATVKHSST